MRQLRLSRREPSRRLISQVREPFLEVLVVVNGTCKGFLLPFTLPQHLFSREDAGAVLATVLATQIIPHSVESLESERVRWRIKQ